MTKDNPWGALTDEQLAKPGAPPSNLIPLPDRSDTEHENEHQRRSRMLGIIDRHGAEFNRLIADFLEKITIAEKVNIEDDEASDTIVGALLYMCMNSGAAMTIGTGRGKEAFLKLASANYDSTLIQLKADGMVE